MKHDVKNNQNTKIEKKQTTNEQTDRQKNMKGSIKNIWLQLASFMFPAAKPGNNRNTNIIENF
jgi:hypothetical protein